MADDTTALMPSMAKNGEKGGGQDAAAARSPGYVSAFSPRCLRCALIPVGGG